MLDNLKNALTATNIPFRAYAWASAPKNGNYGVYGLDGQGAAVYSDCAMVSQAVEGTVDLFCRTDAFTDFNKVQNALNSSGVAWRLNSVQFEDTTQLIHYEWVFQAVHSIG